MSDGVQIALVVGLFVALALLVGYQGYMLWWTKQQTGAVPGAVKVLRVLNIVLLVLAGVGMAVWLMGR